MRAAHAWTRAHTRTRTHKNARARRALVSLRADVKPANLVLSERARRFKVIDLGGATDLRVGKNFEPDRAILDPAYAPPETYVLPEETPVPPPEPVAALLSPALWLFNRPHLFDTYSCGILLLQMSVPGLRQPAALRQFNASIATQELDLAAWRDGEWAVCVHASIRGCVCVCSCAVTRAHASACAQVTRAPR